MDQLMDFSEFLKLNESKDSIDLSSAISFFKKNCDDYDVNNPLYRRMKLQQAEYVVIDPSDRVRKSSTGSNYILNILDSETKSLNANYPLRSNSSFFTMDRSSILPRFGDLYIIIPINDSVIAVAGNTSDINMDLSSGLEKLVSEMENNYISDDNYNHMIKDIKYTLDSGKSSVMLQKAFVDCNSIKDIINRVAELCSLDTFKIKFTDIKDIQKNKIKGEAWCKTKCLMIRESEWYDFKEELKKVH